MSLFVRARPAQPQAEERAVGLPFERWIRMFGGGSGVTPSSVATIDVALGNSVVWRCAMKNASTVASFPVHTYRGRDVVPDPRIVANPAPGEMLRSVWVFAATLSMYLRGGAYGLVGPDDAAAAGRPQSWYLIHPDRVEWSPERGWLLDGKPVDLYPLGPLWHVPMYVLPGSPKGLNPLEYARRSLFPGMAAQEFGSNFFQQGAHPTALIQPERDPGADGAQALKDRVLSATSGTNREPIVLPQSVKWQQIQVSPEDSQFIETMRLSDEQVCRYMGTPPEEVGIAPSGSSLTYANREQRKQDYLQELLLPVRRLQEAWSELIPRPQVVKLNPAGLLRADIKTRFEVYRTAAEIQSMTGEAVLTVDEMRDFEDLAPLDDNDSTTED